MNRSHKRRAVRDFPPGCGTKSDVSRCNLPDEEDIENSRTTEHVAAAHKPKRTEFKDYVHDQVLAKPKRACFKQDTQFKSSEHRHFQKGEGSSCDRQEPETENYNQCLSPREKVLEVLHHFNEVFKKLDRDKRCGTVGSSDTTNRIDIMTQAVLEEMGKVVNTQNRIGSVPGVEVGDEFKYKTELRVVGLHFRTMCGIDYMKIGETKYATSIVASEGYGYNDKFGSDVVVYTGEGGNVIGKDKKAEDQRMDKGNLALANSKEGRREVRVIRGEESWDRKGKRYVYDGLYLVDAYWSERGASGKSVYKFRLCRIPSQPPST